MSVKEMNTQGIIIDDKLNIDDLLKEANELESKPQVSQKTAEIVSKLGKEHLKREKELLKQKTNETKKLIRAKAKEQKEIIKYNKQLEKHNIKEQKKQEKKEEKHKQKVLSAQDKKIIEDAIHEKETLITKIVNYQNSKIFGEYVRHNLNINFREYELDTYGIKKLKMITNKIRKGLQNRSTDIFYNNLAKNGTKILESLVTGFGYDIKGYSDDILNDPTFWETYEEFKIENGTLPTINCKYKLAYILIYSMYMRNTINLMEKRKELQEKANRRKETKHNNTPTNNNNPNSFQNIEKNAIIDIIDIDENDLKNVDIVDNDDDDDDDDDNEQEEKEKEETKQIKKSNFLDEYSF